MASSPGRGGAVGPVGRRIGGTASFFLPVAEEMLAEVAENVTVRPIEHSGHWLSEEQPEQVLERLREFTGTAGR
ncbi:hypothetical protein SAMN05216223_11848 [Actinacidiphila yanglinensis]|uniref:Haloalkane dehalogenase n=1 Tax=Actinacidiphila yanglinensis TaxID=310779 RepID=A0A1H6DPG6_9ACTN|nr:alpha/beta hydrolase [Actinacidiphila yanglinensis]SEG87158.1 hypothetical protein SAMN05216223_11848 [Actinacidiphila yanglinensis]